MYFIENTTCLRNPTRAHEHVALPMCTPLCKSAVGAAYKQTPLHINKRRCIQANGAARMHRPDAHVQSAVFMCKVVCLYAAPRVHVQQRVHMCTAVCSFVDPSARVHNPRVYLQRALHINKRLCTQANGSARMHGPDAHVHSAVFMCKVVCLYAASRVHVQ